MVDPGFLASMNLMFCLVPNSEDQASRILVPFIGTAEKRPKTPPKPNPPVKAAVGS